MKVVYRVISAKNVQEMCVKKVIYINQKIENVSSVPKFVKPVKIQ